MKSIKSKILVSMLACVVSAVLLVGAISSLMGYNGTMETLQDSMIATAAIAADRVSYQLLEYKTIAQDAGCLPILTDAAATMAEKEAALQERVDTYGLQRYNLLDATGKSYLDGNDYSSRTYFQQSIRGNAWVSEPLVSAVTGEVTIIVSAPVYQDGDTARAIVGVVYFVPQETFLNDIVTSIQISDNGSAYMLDSEGNTIAHKNMESVKNVENTINDAKSDSSLSALAAIESSMIAGQSGYDRYTYGGESKMMAYAPVNDTNGWSIAVNAPVKDFTAATIRALVVTMILLVVTIIAAFILSLRLANGIGKPIKICADRLCLLAEGDLDTPVEHLHSKDEVGELVSSTQTIVDSLRNIIGDIDYQLSEMGNGNFTVESQTAASYTGNYKNILASVRQIREKLSGTLAQISLSASQITLGSGQVSDGAQSLAQGATEQATSAEQLVEMVGEINDALIRANQAAMEASTKADDAGQVAGECNDHMKELVTAMQEISSTSERIGKIIKEIDDIAFQTNILALNAAVEAARAGAAGKGFAVVADEVRNLATKSAESAKNTSDLVEASMSAVAKGSHLVDATASRLQTVSDNSIEMAALMQNIAATAQQSTDSVQRVHIGVEQISSVIQSTSATSEESAAASEELSTQAQLLDDLVRQFHLANR